MITRLLSLSVQAHWPVVFVTAMVAAYGTYELTRLPLDALPDITSKQVMINYAAPALGPEDVWAEIGEIGRGSRPGRTGPDDIFVFKSVGNAMQDLALASIVYRRAVAHGLGHVIAL